MANELKGLAKDVNQVSSSLSALGIDMTSFQTTAAAFGLIAGSAQIVSALIAVKQAYNAARLAEGLANVAKWGPYALVVGPLALAGGYAIGEIIERTINTRDDGAGIRALAEV